MYPPLSAIHQHVWAFLFSAGPRGKIRKEFGLWRLWLWGAKDRSGFGPTLSCATHAKKRNGQGNNGTLLGFAFEREGYKTDLEDYGK